MDKLRMVRMLLVVFLLFDTCLIVVRSDPQMLRMLRQLQHGAKADGEALATAQRVAREWKGIAKALQDQPPAPPALPVGYSGLTVGAGIAVGVAGTLLYQQQREWYLSTAEASEVDVHLTGMESSSLAASLLNGVYRHGKGYVFATGLMRSDKGVITALVIAEHDARRAAWQQALEAAPWVNDTTPLPMDASLHFLLMAQGFNSSAHRPTLTIGDASLYHLGCFLSSLRQAYTSPLLLLPMPTAVDPASLALVLHEPPSCPAAHGPSPLPTCPRASHPQALVTITDQHAQHSHAPRAAAPSSASSAGLTSSSAVDAMALLLHAPTRQVANPIKPPHRPSRAPSASSWSSADASCNGSSCASSAANCGVESLEDLVAEALRDMEAVLALLYQRGSCAVCFLVSSDCPIECFFAFRQDESLQWFQGTGTGVKLLLWALLWVAVVSVTLALRDTKKQLWLSQCQNLNLIDAYNRLREAFNLLQQKMDDWQEEVSQLQERLQRVQGQLATVKDFLDQEILAHRRTGQLLEEARRELGYPTASGVDAVVAAEAPLALLEL